MRIKRNTPRCANRSNSGTSKFLDVAVFRVGRAPIQEPYPKSVYNADFQQLKPSKFTYYSSYSQIFQHIIHTFLTSSKDYPNKKPRGIPQSCIAVRSKSSRRSLPGAPPMEPFYSYEVFGSERSLTCTDQILHRRSLPSGPSTNRVTV